MESKAYARAAVSDDEDDGPGQTAPPPVGLLRSCKVVIYSNAKQKKVVYTKTGTTIDKVNATLYDLPMSTDYYYYLELNGKPWKFIRAAFAFAPNCDGCSGNGGECFEHPSFNDLRRRVLGRDPLVWPAYLEAKQAAAKWGLENVAKSRDGVQYICV